jgi:hypothetical protein
MWLKQYSACLASVQVLSSNPKPTKKQKDQPLAEKNVSGINHRTDFEHLLSALGKQ